jgi:hypothetical protein
VATGCIGLSQSRKKLFTVQRPAINDIRQEYTSKNVGGENDPKINSIMEWNAEKRRSWELVSIMC